MIDLNADPIEIKASGTGTIQVPIRPGYRFVLSYLRIHFRRLGGSGTEVATLTIDLDSQWGDDFDVRLRSLASSGVGNDVVFRVNDEEVRQWKFESADGLTINWTNPDIDEIRWGLMAGIIPWA